MNRENDRKKAQSNAPLVDINVNWLNWGLGVFKWGKERIFEVRVEGAWFMDWDLI
jgi:hypothetical protein